MSNYTKTTNFAAKDSLPSGNAGKIVKGTEIDAEFNNIATASATKADINDVTLTGTTTFGSLNDGTITITGWVDEDNMSSNSAVLVPTQQSVKAYVDSTTTAQDLDVTDGSASIDIDLDSESLGILGGTGVTSTASGTGVTLAIDSTVATLTGTQTLTNKTLTTPTILTSFTIGSATISEAELEILDGATVTTAELNVLDGITSTTAELNILDGVTSTAAELNILDGVTSTTAELNILDGVTSSATELNILDGVTSTTAELNILDGVTSTTAELNILDGVTSTTAELNILDGVTSTATELNLLDGVTATTAELNYTDGVTSAIQTQLDSKISGADAALTGNATITTSDNTTQLALISTDADANAGPILDLFRNSVSAADGDLTGQVYFSGKNDADEKTYYGQITSQISDVSNGSEDFNLELSTLTAGSSNSRLLVTPTETVFNEQSADLDFRIESDGNTSAFFLEGSSGNTGIGISPSYKLTVNSGATTETTAAAIGYNGDAGTNLYINTDHGNNLVSLYASGSASKEMRFLSGTLEVMRLGTTGNVGIGTGTTVNRKLEVAGNNNGGAKANYIRITDTDTSATANNQAGGIEFFTNDVTAGIAASMEVLYAGSGGGGEITFNTNASSSGTLTEAMRIDASGNVGIGGSPVEKFYVTTSSGDARIGLNAPSGSDTEIKFSNAGTVEYSVGHDDGTDNFVIGTANVDTPLISVTKAGNIGIGTNSPRSVTNYSVVGINGTSGSAIDFELGEALKTSFTQSAGQFEINVVPALPLIFKTSNTERMRIDSLGRVTMPYQPAFLALPSGTQANIPINANTTVAFGSEAFDQGGNFTSNTFTAPVTGKYQLNVNLYCLTVDSSSDYVQVALRTSNRLYYYIFSTDALDQDAFYMSFPLSVLADMDEDDTATVEIQLPNSGASQMDVNSVSSFSGYLVA